MKKCGLAAAGLGLMCSVVIAAPLGTLRGSVADSEGAVIDFAHIIVHEDTSGKPKPGGKNDIVLKTNASGRFNVQLEPGFYDICVMAMGFTPRCYKVLMDDGQTSERRTQLRIDPIIVERLGHEIPGVR